MVSLGLNMMEQEVIDMTNTVARNGLVYFPEFCAVVLKKFREEDEEQFSQIMFKVGIRHRIHAMYPHGVNLVRCCVVLSLFLSCIEPKNTGFIKSF